MASLGPELIAQIGPMPITNTLITTFVVDAVIVGIVISIYKKVSLIPTGLQSVFEPIIAYFYDLTEQISGSKAKTIFPWFASFFLFILFANLIGLLPGFGTIGFWEEGEAHTERAHSEEPVKQTVSASKTDEGLMSASETEAEEKFTINSETTHNEAATGVSETTPERSEAITNGDESNGSERHLVPILRAATSDFNLTLALGTISIVATHIISISYNGLFGYLKKFLSKNPIYLFIGILEFILEAVKIFSLSFRLFGNIFAGEVVLITVAGLATYSAFFAPIPFLLLETIVALVQALVFAMLTMVFMSLLATTSSEGGGH